MCVCRVQQQVGRVEVVERKNSALAQSREFPECVCDMFSDCVSSEGGGEQVS